MQTKACQLRDLRGSHTNGKIQFLIQQAKIKFVIQLTQSNGSLNAVFRYKNGSIAPVFINTLNYQLDTNIVGQLQYKTSMSLTGSFMSTALIYERENLNMNVRFQLSVKNTFLSLNLSRKFMDNDLKVKSSAQYGFMGMTFSYGIEKQITKFTRIDTSIIINSLAGVVLNLE